MLSSEKSLGFFAETGEHIELLDVCCGVGTLAKRVLRGIGADATRISYLAIDRDSACIDGLKAEQERYNGFRKFRALQREVSDLHDLLNGSIDLVVLNNVLHEISPRFYPAMFSQFNRLRRPRTGRITIVDMEELPIDAPEAIAITWKGSEVDEFLRAGGFSPEVTLHDKVTPVYQVHVRALDGSVDESAVRERLKVMLLKKVHEVVLRRRQLEARLGRNDSEYRQWLVPTGTLARCADELLALGVF